VAPDEVVARLFVRTVTGTPKLDQCGNVGTDQWDCLFTGADPEIQVRVVQEGEAFRVESFVFV
jgi:hypothetical protein